MTAVAVVALAVFGLSACSAIDKVKNAVHDVRGNKAIVDGFNAKLNNAPTTFEAVYTTTGSAPALPVPPVSPPASLPSVPVPSVPVPSLGTPSIGAAGVTAPGVTVPSVSASGG